TLPEFIDTGDLLAKALREDVAFVPGQAAYVDGRGRSSMRLNFSGSDEEEIEEGVRRIGKVIAQQVELYSTLTRERAGDEAHMPAAEESRPAASSAPARPRESDMDAAGLPRPGAAGEGGGPAEGGDVLPFRKEESA